MTWRLSFVNFKWILSKYWYNTLLRYTWYTEITRILWPQPLWSRMRLEAWFHTRMLRVSWVEHAANEHALQRAIYEKELISIIKCQKISYMGHVLRGEKHAIIHPVLKGKNEGASEQAEGGQHALETCKTDLCCSRSKDTVHTDRQRSSRAHRRRSSWDESAFRDSWMTNNS